MDPKYDQQPLEPQQGPQEEKNRRKILRRPVLLA